VKVIFKLAADLNPVEADPGQVEQVLVNLLMNAHDAMPNGGQVTIVTENLECDEASLKAHPELKHGSYVVLKVIDTGCGMDANSLAHLFEPFFTTKGLGKGSGLGLATVYGIVKHSNGYIWVESEVAQGTTFTICLPRNVNDPTTKSSDAPSTCVPDGPATILLVEDEPAIRALAKMVLQREGYLLVDAGSAEEALQICQQYKGTIHLLLTDMGLPKMNGRDLADQLTQVMPSIKLLFMTGEGDDAMERDGTLSSDSHLLHKPFAPDALSRTVRQVLATSG
jgi:two-component system, cell cycle sensor histidine kinase and response regulator CckA